MVHVQGILLAECRIMSTAPELSFLSPPGNAARAFALVGALLTLGLANGCGTTATAPPDGSDGGRPPGSSAGGSKNDPNPSTGGSKTDPDPSSGGTKTTDPENGPLDLTCKDPVPLLPGVDTGFVRCDDRTWRRTEVKACPSSVPRPDELEPLRPRPDHAMGGEGGLDPDQPYDSCSSDSDCTEENWYCGERNDSQLPFGRYRECMPGCIVDEDCGPDAICLCDDPIGRCIPAGCRTSEDCPDSACVGARYTSSGCPSQPQFECVRETDQCLKDADCSSGSFCEWGRDGERVCETRHC